mmetsp:Transcript_28129/g.85957  ORF Transcript_28129/g.85957 Transcript_28129/m.85957 type:complete len:151 (-) Transcript_28129:2991-3443(-)|eukprot:scaffold236177_cov31-Tisochrysis_lutea.AAC.1
MASSNNLHGVKATCSIIAEGDGMSINTCIQIDTTPKVIALASEHVTPGISPARLRAISRTMHAHLPRATCPSAAAVGGNRGGRRRRSAAAVARAHRRRRRPTPPHHGKMHRSVTCKLSLSCFALSMTGACWWLDGIHDQAHCVRGNLQPA